MRKILGVSVFFVGCVWCLGQTSASPSLTASLASAQRPNGAASPARAWPERSLPSMATH